MRTNIEIDDQLLEQALLATGLKTKRAVVEAGLRMLLHLKGQQDILRLVGKVRWEGDLDESRQGREPLQKVQLPLRALERLVA